MEKMDVVEMPAENQELSFTPIRGRRKPLRDINRAEKPRARKRRMRRIWLNQKGIDVLTVVLSMMFTIGLFVAMLGIQEIEQNIMATGGKLITGFLLSVASLAILQALNERS